MHQILPSPGELMKLHAEALYTHDEYLRLREVNESAPGAAIIAPRFFLGRATDGTNICRFRYDIPDTIIRRVEELCTDEPPLADLQSNPKHADAYRQLFPSKDFTAGPSFLVPEQDPPAMPLVHIHHGNIARLVQHGFAWLMKEIDHVQPCMAVVHNGQAVSICRSVRITPHAHEAGLETLEGFRGRGYAAAAVAGWARMVREAGCLPLYSTSIQNAASRRVAAKMGLMQYGGAFTIE